VWACAVNPLSESSTLVKCSIPIWVALCFMGGSPRPASFKGLCTPSVGKLGSRPRACLNALLRMPSMVVSCLSLNTPRCVACYLDLRSCSIAIVLRLGLRLRLAKVLASFWTSLVM
jgi:hypothetical protein